MEFSPFNSVVKLCLQGMEMEDKGKPEEALKLFLAAWNEAKNDFERFIAAFYVARQQENSSDKLHWYQLSLEAAQKVDNNGANSAFAALYANIAKCHQQLGDLDNAEKNRALSVSFANNPSDNGPFYHGTRADLQVGDLLTPGRISNYNPQVTMNHIYFTAMANGAGLAAALAKGEGRERVYIVDPTGNFENDPNVTDKKFPGNPTRSYRTSNPLKIVGEITDWIRQSPEEIEKWREKLANNNGEIIN
jgi:rifampin ADP-ribosylating transferase